jgi:hypothetical protein
MALCRLDKPSSALFMASDVKDEIKSIALSTLIADDHTRFPTLNLEERGGVFLIHGV